MCIINPSAVTKNLFYLFATQPQGFGQGSTPGSRWSMTLWSSQSAISGHSDWFRPRQMTASEKCQEFSWKCSCMPQGQIKCKTWGCWSCFCPKACGKVESTWKGGLRGGADRQEPSVTWASPSLSNFIFGEVFSHLLYMKILHIYYLSFWGPGSQV